MAILDRYKQNWLYKMLDLMPLRQPSDQGDIFIFTVSRSGLTWLLEMLNTQPNTRCLQAIFAAWQTDVMRHYFEPHMRYISPSTQELEKMQRYLADILAHKIYRLPYHPLNPSFKFKTDLNILVITEACPLINWFSQTFNGRILYLVRHPVANALSRLRNRWHEMEAYPEKGWYGFIDIFLENEPFCQTYLNPGLVEQCWHIRHEGTLLERYIVNWCLDNVIPFRYLPQRPWLLVAYEDIVLNSEETLLHIADFCRLPQPEKMQQKVNHPSKSTNMSEQKTVEMIHKNDRSYLISRWRDQLSAKEIGQCFDILSSFGLDLYTPNSDTPNPKYNVYKQLR